MLCRKDSFIPQLRWILLNCGPFHLNCMCFICSQNFGQFADARFCPSRAAAVCAKQHLNSPRRSFVHLCSFLFPIRAPCSWHVFPSFPHLYSLLLASIETITFKCSLWPFFFSGGNKYRRGKKQRKKWEYNIPHWNFNEPPYRHKTFGVFCALRGARTANEMKHI